MAGYKQDLKVALIHGHFMEYTILGRTGLKVSVAGLGCGGGSKLGFSSGGTEETAVGLIRKAIDLGVNFIDTASSYGTEPAVGKAIADINRDDVVLSTKFHPAWAGVVVTPEEIINGLENSLKTLGVEYVDVFHLHGLYPKWYGHVLDNIVPKLLEERDKGKFKYLGVTENAPGDHRHETLIKAIEETSEEINKSPRDFSWMDIIVYLSPKINATAFKALCSIGFFSTKATNTSRNKALYEYLIFRELTKAETNWVINNYPKKRWTNLYDCFIDLAPTKKEGGGTSKTDRSQIVSNEADFINNPPYSLEDDPAWIIEQENKFLGCPVSLSRIDAADTSIANTLCKDVLNGKTGKDLCIAANVNRVATTTVKRGKTKGRKMAFLTIEDNTCCLDSVVVFPETRDKYQYIIYEGNNLLLCGDVSKDNSFIVNKIHEI